MTEFIDYFYNSRMKKRNFIKISVFHPPHVPFFFSETKEAVALLEGSRTGKEVFTFWPVKQN